jgi:AcrR family transcriptional regulator
MRPTPVVPRKVTPDYADLATPAKARIALAARRLFMMYGISAPLRSIAELAESNEATAIQYYESHSNLVRIYVEDLIRANESLWTEAEAKHPDDPEAQLRAWFEAIEILVTEAWGEESQLARVTAQLYRARPTPQLKLVRLARIKELMRIVRLCERAKFDEPSSLAHKLALLADGARSNSNSFEAEGPHSHLCEAASDMMAVHRGGGKLVSPLD